LYIINMVINHNFPEKKIAKNRQNNISISFETATKQIPVTIIIIVSLLRPNFDGHDKARQR